MEQPEIADEATEKKKKRAPRDPEGRKQAIINAAADIIAEEGTGKVTNRKVAQRAGVPLGSTTQYFKGIEELRAAALAEVARRFQDEYNEAFTITEQGIADESVLVDSILAYLSDTELTRTDAALRMATMEEPVVQGVVKDAFASFLEKCETIMDRQQALILFAFIEGAMFNSAYAGISYGRDTIEKAIRIILGK